MNDLYDKQLLGKVIKILDKLCKKLHIKSLDTMFDTKNAMFKDQNGDESYSLYLPYKSKKANSAAYASLSDQIQGTGEDFFAANQISHKGEKFIIGDGDDTYAYRESKDKKGVFIWVRSFESDNELATKKPRTTKAAAKAPSKTAKPAKDTSPKIKEIKAAMRKLSGMKSVKTYIGLAKKLQKLQG